MLNQNFVFVGVAINIIGLSSYFVSILRGDVRPNRMSFVMWSLAGLVVFFAEIKQGVGLQALMPLTVGLGPIAIVLASFLNKKLYWKLTAFDFFCGSFSLLGLLLWRITGVGNIAIFFSIIADGLPYLPVIVKAWKFPETESAWPWLTVSINALFAMLTIRSFMFANFAFPLYSLVTNFIVFAGVQFKLGKLRDA